MRNRMRWRRTASIGSSSRSARPSSASATSIVTVLGQELPRLDAAVDRAARAGASAGRTTRGDDLLESGASLDQRPTRALQVLGHLIVDFEGADAGAKPEPTDGQFVGHGSVHSGPALVGRRPSGRPPQVRVMGAAGWS